MNQQISQFDGNITINSASDTGESICSCCNDVVCCESTVSSNDSEYDDEGISIPVLTAPNVLPYQWPSDPPAWFDEYLPGVIDPYQSRVNRITIKRDNRLVNSELLPIISVSNLRSLQMSSQKQQRCPLVISSHFLLL